MPASQPGSPDLTHSCTESLSPHQDAVILQSGEEIEILAPPAGTATAFLPAEVHAAETALGKPESFDEASPQDTDELISEPGKTPEGVHQPLSVMELIDEAAPRDQDPLAENVSGSLHDSIGHDGQEPVPESMTDPDLFYEKDDMKRNARKLDANADDVNMQPASSPAKRKIDSVQPDSAELLGSCHDATDVASSSPTKKRLMARISDSDDTTMLKAFVSRAQAKKALNAAKSSPTKEIRTPRRSPRKILGNLDRNSPSPVKQPRQPLKAGKLPGTPRSKSASSVPHPEDDEDEISMAPTSQRRSTRKRSPAPPATSICTVPDPAGPSRIPFRRPDGSEPVRMQSIRSEAQELALMTRANTRRNKGKAQMPRAILKALTSGGAADEPAVVATAAAAAAVTATPQRGRPRKYPLKNVDWDATLVYYPDVKDNKACKGQSTRDDKDKKQRIRGLGASNGTPMVKKSSRSVAMETTARPSTPRRTGRVRG